MRLTSRIGPHGFLQRPGARPPTRRAASARDPSLTSTEAPPTLTALIAPAVTSASRKIVLGRPHLDALPDRHEYKPSAAFAGRM